MGNISRRLGGCLLGRHHRNKNRGHEPVLWLMSMKKVGGHNQHGWVSCLWVALVLLWTVGCEQLPPELTPPPEEPKGTPVTLEDDDLRGDVPEGLQETLSWHRKGDLKYLVDEYEEALYCFHKAERTFPKEQPTFVPGSDWSFRTWSGRPHSAYLAKADVYCKLERFDLAARYLRLARNSQEHPSDLDNVRLTEARLLYAQGRFQAASELTKSDYDLVGRLIRCAARIKAGDAQAEAEAFFLWKEVLALPGQIRPWVKAALPVGAWELLEETQKKAQPA